MPFSSTPLAPNVTKDEFSALLGMLEIVSKDEELNEQIGMQVLGDLEEWNDKMDALHEKLKKILTSDAPLSCSR